MPTMNAEVAIVDYGMGNLFSVAQACRHVGLDAGITNRPDDVVAARAVILPGVGAFGDAMAALQASGLAAALQEIAARERPLLGICLGMQLLFDESEEFGQFRGLGLLSGAVRRLETNGKVPQVGWNRVREPTRGRWEGTLLATTPPESYVYFVHSYVVEPADREDVLAIATYVDCSFCAAVKRGSLVGCQFHPERSGELGLDIYRAWRTTWK